MKADLENDDQTRVQEKKPIINTQTTAMGRPVNSTQQKRWKQTSSDLASSSLPNDEIDFEYSKTG